MKKHRMHLASKRIDMQNFEDTGILGRENSKVNLEKIVTALRAYLFKAVAAHEVGHTLGLRHNFAGSADALNYHDHYWEIRNPEAKTLDLPSREEMQAGIREYAYSSIMDYGARLNSDIRGIGKYDVAAIKFGYGQLVETFTNPLIGISMTSWASTTWMMPSKSGPTTPTSRPFLNRAQGPKTAWQI